MRSFLWCLGPAILGFLILAAAIVFDDDNNYYALPTISFLVGAVISGVIVAKAIALRIPTSAWWRDMAIGFGFLAICISYLGATIVGCSAAAFEFGKIEF